MTLLKAAREQRGWSQAALVARLAEVARAEGVTLPGWQSMKRQLARWESGQTIPADYYRALLEKAFNSSASTLGLAGSGGVERSSLGLDMGGPVATVKVVTEMWEADLDRREFLRSAAWAAGGYVLPASSWSRSSSTTPLTRATGRLQVGSADLDTLQDLVDAYRKADNRSGGGAVRERLVRTLHHEVTPLLTSGRFDEATGSRLMSITAEMTQLAGWMAYDCGLHGLSQRYLVQALALARSASDEVLGGEILAAMAHQSAYLGNTSEAVQTARAAARSGRRAGQSHLVAEAAVLEAQGHAKAGATAEAVSALTRAEVALDHADQSTPGYLAYFDEAYLSAKFGHVFLALRDGEHTTRHAERALEMRPGYERGRAFNLALLACGHALSGQVEEAVRVGARAAESTAEMTSARAVGYVRDVAAALKPAASVPDVAEFRRRVRYLRHA